MINLIQRINFILYSNKNRTMKIFKKYNLVVIKVKEEQADFNYLAT